jgi:hypothetical protein
MLQIYCGEGQDALLRVAQCAAASDEFMLPSLGVGDQPVDVVMDIEEACHCSFIP